MTTIVSVMTDKIAFEHTRSDVFLSSVVPIYNEADNIGPFFDRLKKILDALGEPYEIICVDDGSTDESADLLVAERSRNPAVKIVRLSRNFGEYLGRTYMEAKGRPLYLVRERHGFDGPETWSKSRPE